MKRIFLTVIVCFAFIASMAMAADVSTKNVGITKAGLHYLSGAWVENWSLGDPRFNDGKHGWTGQGLEMKYNSQIGYWTVQLPIDYGKRVQVIFTNELGYSNMWSAHEAVKAGFVTAGEAKAKPDKPGCVAVDNTIGGYNWVCTPVDKAPWE